MTTFGWVLILFGVICARFAINGRGVTNMVEDLGDIVTGAVSGDYAAVTEALGRKGQNYDAPVQDEAVPVASAPSADGTHSAGGVLPEGGIGPVGAGPGTATGLKLLAAMKARAAKATGYTLGSTGPTRYDCSGLLWRAMQDIDVPVGARFTTHTWKALAAKLGAVKIGSPEPGAVVWFPGHIGVVESSTHYFSALNPTKGILSNPIRYTVDSNGPAEYWRLP